MWINKLTRGITGRPPEPPKPPPPAAEAQRTWPGHGTPKAAPGPSAFAQRPSGLTEPAPAHLRPEAQLPTVADRRVHDAHSFPMPDRPQEVLVRPEPLAPERGKLPFAKMTEDEKQEHLLQRSYNTLPHPPGRDGAGLLHAEGSDPRLRYGSAARTDPAPDLQAEMRLPLRRDSISLEHTLDQKKQIDLDYAAMQTHPNGSVPMAPHLKAAANLFREQRLAFERDPAYAKYSNRKQREIANQFGYDPADPKRIRAYGTGPGPGGAYIGEASGNSVYIPPPKDPNIVLSMHDHNKGHDNFFSPEDISLAALNRTHHGVPTEAMVHRPPGKPRGEGEEVYLTNGRVATTGQDGKPSVTDRPEQFRALPTKDVFIGPASKDLRSIPFADLRPKPPAP